MISRVEGPSVSLMGEMAAFLVVAGLVIWLLSRRAADRYTGRVLLVGVPGLYLAGLPSFGAPKWLYIPGLSLLACTYIMQIVVWQRQKANKDAAPSDTSGSA